MKSNKALYILLALILLSSLLIVTIVIADAPLRHFGISYLDVNQNGKFDGDDVALAGWTINLSNPSGLVGSVYDERSRVLPVRQSSAGKYNIARSCSLVTRTLRL